MAGEALAFSSDLAQVPRGRRLRLSLRGGFGGRGGGGRPAAWKAAVRSHGPGRLWHGWIPHPCPLADTGGCCHLTRAVLDFPSFVNTPVLQKVFHALLLL